MESRGQIENLLYEYQERIDDGDLRGVAEMFAHAQIRAEGSAGAARGAEQIFQMYSRFIRLYDGQPHTTHTNLNPIIHIDEAAGAATCRSTYVVFQATPGLALQPIITGRYHDRFERVEGSWRFAERVMITRLVGDLSQHQLGAGGDEA